MTPQERQLVVELFDRLASLESSPRDPDAERAIADGLARAPHATYALVQTALVQDEALKRAHARIEELEGGGQGEAPRAGFLDNMRDALFGRDERRGSVPPVRPGGLGSSGAWGQPAGGMGSGMGSGMGMGPGMGPAQMGPSPIGMGGSFLGTAAASAAGVIGGAMLLNGIRSMFGHPYGGAAFGPGAAAASPWGGGAADSDLARQAGIDSIGRPGARDDDRGDDAGGGGRAGLFGGDDQDNDDNSDDNDYDSGDDGDFGGGDTDSA